MIIDFLNRLDISSENSFESLGQILDSIAQVLEEIIKKITKKNTLTRSFGELELFLRNNNLPELADLLNEIRVFRKEINIREPEVEKVAILRDMAVELIKKTEFSTIKHKYRIRYTPQIENSSGLESQSGFSKFNLFHGSISHINCKTLIISASKQKNKLDGQVINALKWRYVVDEDANYTLFKNNSCEIFYYNMKKQESLFDHLVILSVIDELDTINSDLQKHLYIQLFASLNLLEYLGVDISEIGMSFLLGNRVEDKELSVELLIFESLMWLKQAKTTKCINCSLLHMEELNLWNKTMNSVLGRSSIDPKSNPIIDTLKMDLINILEKHKSSTLSDGIVPLYSALNTKQGLNIELVCTFARTLCELIVNDVNNKHNIKTSSDLLSSIEKLRNDGIISPWISSYMHGIRIMGNKSVHPPKKTPKYSPIKLETGDLASTLMGIRLLLEFWEKNTYV